MDNRMRVIQLTQSQHTVVDDDVYEWASKLKWYAQKSGNTFYAVRSLPRSGKIRSVQCLHREILKAPPGVEVDHIDGDGLNNLRENIRTCTHAENARNRRTRRDCTSRFKGVYFDRRRGLRPWRAEIKVNGVYTHLGHFNTAVEAAIARDKAATTFQGAFARLNFPQGHV